MAHLFNNTTDNHMEIENVPDDDGKIINEHFLYVFRLIVTYVINNVIVVMGVATNLLNIYIFTRHGAKDSVPVTMSTLAFWDLVKCLSGLVHQMTPFIALFSIPFSMTWEAVHIPKTVYIHIIAGYVSYPIAAYVAFERAICVSLPFTFKKIANRKVATISMIVMSVGGFTMFVPCFLIFDVKFKFDPLYNQSIAYYMFSDFYRNQGPQFMPYYNYIGIALPIACFLVILISTLVIIIRLKKRPKNLPASSNVAQQSVSEKGGKDKVQSRDQRTTKMLLWIMGTFIVNLIPRITHHIVKILVPEYFIGKAYHNLFFVVSGFVFFSDFFNSSVNFFIFLTMSTSFREGFFKISLVSRVRHAFCSHESKTA